MKKCAVCGTTILFGPVRSGEHVYCGYECRDKGQFEQQTAIVPDEIAVAMAMKINMGDCPKCGGPGPVDVQYAYTVWSVFVLMSCKSNPEVSCVSCGRKAKFGAILFSFGLGWWGLPFGFIITPIQILRNFFGMFGGPVHGNPSPDLQPIAKLMLADEVRQRDSYVDARTTAT